MNSDFGCHFCKCFLVYRVPQSLFSDHVCHHLQDKLVCGLLKPLVLYNAVYLLAEVGRRKTPGPGNLLSGAGVMRMPVPHSSVQSMSLSLILTTNSLTLPRDFPLQGTPFHLQLSMIAPGPLSLSPGPVKKLPPRCSIYLPSKLPIQFSHCF